MIEFLQKAIPIQFILIMFLWLGNDILRTYIKRLETEGIWDYADLIAAFLIFFVVVFFTQLVIFYSISDYKDICGMFRIE